MRIVGIETSSRRGSIALLEGSRCVAQIEHEEPNSHAERVLSLLEQVLADAGWAKNSLERIAVGTGPGTFVGLRVGIALAEGLSLGLGCPLVGVSSLTAMLRAMPAELSGTRIALLDARRGEVFAAAENAQGQCLLKPRAVSAEDLPDLVASWGPDVSVAGEIVEALPQLRELASWQRGPGVDLPSARFVAAIAQELVPEQAPAAPDYVRGPGATLPKLPPSPLGTTSSPSC